ETVTEEFTGKNLTRFGGAGLIRRFFQRHHIQEKIEQGVPVEGRRQCKYSVGTMLVSLLYGMFLGYPRPSQMEVLATDKVFQKIAGLVSFPVQSTISRFLDGLKVVVARQIAVLNFDLLLKFREGFRAFFSITLDLDSHVSPVYGRQQRAGRGYNPKKKGRRSYHPLFCFIGETRDYLAGLLRSGKHHTSYQAIPFLKGILKKLPAHIQKIRLRADSGFFSLDFLKFLVKRSIEFYVVVPLQPWIQKKIWGIKDWKDIGWGVAVSELEYVLEKGIILRLVVIRKRVKRGESPKKQLKLLAMEEVLYDYQVIVTNGLLVAEEVWRFYNQRACCENFIKEGIYGFGLDKVISHHYAGNYAYFELLMLGYNLMNFFKEGVLHQEKVKRMIQTIRERLFLIPARLIKTAGRWILKQERSWFYRVEYEKALARLT
ncbi:MAG: IS1380 family transposase, partial [Deltaproteobacteria bacterium]|nr:IS1380 family transposase [Deltaproteobacteria bacterium]